MPVAADELTSVQWVGVVGLLVVLLAPFAILLAWWCKRRYTGAIVRLQAEVTAVAAELPAPGASVPSDHVGAPLRIDVAHAASVADHEAVHGARSLRRRVLSVQFCAGALYWFWLLVILFACILSFAPGVVDAPAHQVVVAPMPGVAGAPSTPSTSNRNPWLDAPFALLLILMAPTLAWATQAGLRERNVWLILVGTLAALGIRGIVAGTTWPVALATLTGSTVLWAGITAFLRPAVRGAGPSMLAALIVGVLTMLPFLMVGDAVASPGSEIGWRDALALCFYAAGLSLPFATGRWTLLRIARRYGEKRFSELQLALYAYWGLVTTIALVFMLSVSVAEEGHDLGVAGFAFVALLGWWLWRFLLQKMTRLVTRNAMPQLGPVLLLRVFKPSNRSEAFMDRFLAHWRFVAPVWLIGGPDLCGAFMEPDEFFAWLTNKLRNRFICRPDEIATRLAALDSTRDPDGRFRVNELFCLNTTWQPTVLALLSRAGVVLLDLREYTDQRAGTRFELVEVLRRADLGRVIVLTDEAGDAKVLRARVQAAWVEVGGTRVGPAAPPLLFVQVPDGSDVEIRGLVRAAAKMAAGAC